ncbi:hypothetical protein Tsubulata_050679 [Turnera subulata]|uniref:Core-2/I-branching beta-1,6-N-acetylglucosaminyltransferase family protein n=1 Tax=Turnera subulata TaxID=218843 RepID=A0A9Q0G0D7_9ROSI|nr:hypothetical protein Tsubulata_050679 [Turnera subulata]
MASQVNPSPTNPKKLAFLFLTTAPLPFAPLWELYFNQSPSALFNIYIHADPTKPYDPPFSGVFANRVIPSKPTERLTPTLASAARRLLAHALLHDPANAAFALLSSSCIPLHSFPFTYRTLTRSNLSFIEVLENEKWAYYRWAARGDDAMLPEVKLEDLRIGSQFWALTRAHARLVASDDSRMWRKFNESCVLYRRSCYVEEYYFPTLVHMVDPPGAASATLTHVRWNGGAHPVMYNALDVGPELIQAMRDSRPRYGYDHYRLNGSRVDPFLFARKFSPVCIHALMGIAKERSLGENWEKNIKLLTL